MTFSLNIRNDIRLFICVVAILSKFSAIYSYKPSPKSSPPEIWLSSYQEADAIKDTLAEPEFRLLDEFQNQFISKYNKTDYLITEDTAIVFFTCQAKYPVKWSFPRLSQIEKLHFYIFQTTTTRLSNFNNIANAVPTSEVYQTVLRIQLYNLADIFSVNLTCGIADVKEKGIRKNSHILGQFSSIHIFYAGQHAIENQGSTIQIQAGFSKKQGYIYEVVLPCRPATPTVPILLEKLISNPSNPKNKWKRLKYPTENLNFDPKVGFIMKDISVLGFYRCTVLDEGDDVNQMGNFKWDGDINQRQVVYVNITSSDDTKTDIENIQFQPNIDLKGDATIAYNDEVIGKQTNLSPNKSNEDSEFICCSGVHNMAPSIYSDFCIGYLQCEILKWSITEKLQRNVSLVFNVYSAPESDGLENHSDCTKTSFLYCSVIICKGETVQFADHFLNVFSDHLIPVSNRTQGRINETLSLSIYEPETRIFDIERKIFLTIGYPITSKELEEDDSDQYSRNGFLRLYKPKIIYDFEYELVDERKIAEYPRDHFYVGETLVPICLGWTSFYSNGAFVGINFKNGTRKIVNLKDESSLTDVYFSGGVQVINLYEANKEIEHQLGWQITANKDIMSVECWMPQWNTENWDKIIRNVTILDAVPPRFVNKSDMEAETSVYFYLDDESKDLVWTVESGAPEAKIDVTKDGRGLLKRSTDIQCQFHFDKCKESSLNVTLEKDNGTLTSKVIRIRFAKKVSLEMQGVYKCTVKNIGGIVSRSIRVIVTERRNMLAHVLFVVTIISSLFLTGLGLRHLYQRKQVLLLRRFQT